MSAYNRVVEDEIKKQIWGEGEWCRIPGVNATASIGKVKKDHGMHVDLYAKHEVSPGNHYPVVHSFRGTLDCHGAVFAALPNGLGSMAQMLLPLACSVTVSISTVQEWKANLILGAKRLSKETLISTLEAIIANGDPPFVLELRDGNKNLISFLPTKASLLLNSIRNNGSSTDTTVRYNEPVPNLRPSLFRSAYTWLRWWFWPLIFLLLNMLIFLSPLSILPWIPSLPFASYLGMDNAIIKDANDVLPPVPKSMVHAYQLGMINGQINSLLNGCTAATTSLVTTTPTTVADQQINTLLTEATRLVVGKAGSFSSDALTVAQLNKVLEELIKVESHVSVISRVQGFFTFVNLMWFFAILGITVSIGPSIYSVLKPLHEMFHRVCKWFYLNILLPTVKKLHTWYVFEFLVWQLLILLLCTGIKLDVQEVGLMVCLTSTFLMIPAFTYTTLLKGKKVKTELLTTLTQLYFALVCMPLAIHFNSTFYGYLTVAAVFGSLGFGIWSYPLCIAIGFSNEESMHRVGASAFFLVLSFIIIKVTGLVELQYLVPFSSAISVFGTIILLLALLIMSSQGCNYCKNYDFWRFYNMFMVLMLVSLSFVGHTFGMLGMANTATVFAVLFGLEKYGDFHVRNKWNTWILVLMFSIVVWRLSLFLHSRPEFIASMFAGSIEGV